MHKVAAKAHELGKVWVLDPVGVGATNLRTKTATELVLSHKPTVIRGNASEIIALAENICGALNVETSGKWRLNSCLVPKTLRAWFNFGLGKKQKKIMPWNCLVTVLDFLAFIQFSYHTMKLPFLLYTSSHVYFFSYTCGWLCQTCTSSC